MTSVYGQNRERTGLLLVHAVAAFNPQPTVNHIQLHESLGVSYRTQSGGATMASTESSVTIHMVASLDGFIARKDGRVDWLETSDQFEDGDTLDPEFVQEFLKTIDCYVMARAPTRPHWTSRPRDSVGPMATSRRSS